MILEGGQIRVDLRPIASLLPHEETIPEQLEKLVSHIARDGVQKDPIIVDRETRTVLDGMHRLAAFGKLGYDNVVCCLVDYSSPGIDLKRWARVYRTAKREVIVRALGELGLTKPTRLGDAIDSLEAKKFGIAAFGADFCKVPERPMNLEGAFKIVRSLDQVGSTFGWQRGFAREDEVDVALQDEQNYIVLVERLGKADVLRASLSGRLFPFKTSMHTIDPRPVALDFPTKDLKKATQKSLAEFLSKQSPITLPPNSMYEGRRYKERLLLLDHID